MTQLEFSQFMHQYEKLVFTICYQLIKDYHEAQNLTQETFLSAYTHIDSCDAEHYKPWLARIATNKAKDYLKSAYVRKVRLEEEDESGTSVMERGEQVAGAPQVGIIEETETKEAVEAIKAHVLALKEPYLQVSVMFFLESQDVESISKVLNRPKKTVQTQIYRAKQMLKEAIKEGKR